LPVKRLLNSKGGERYKRVGREGRSILVGRRVDIEPPQAVDDGLAVARCRHVMRRLSVAVFSSGDLAAVERAAGAIEMCERPVDRLAIAEETAIAVRPILYSRMGEAVRYLLPSHLCQLTTTGKRNKQ